eukprot:316293-Prymnesium_polylepis.1
MRTPQSAQSVPNAHWPCSLAIVPGPPSSQMPLFAEMQLFEQPPGGAEGGDGGNGGDGGDGGGDGGGGEGGGGGVAGGDGGGDT